MLLPLSWYGSTLSTSLQPVPAFGRLPSISQVCPPSSSYSLLVLFPLRRRPASGAAQLFAQDQVPSQWLWPSFSAYHPSVSLLCPVTILSLNTFLSSTQGFRNYQALWGKGRCCPPLPAPSAMPVPAKSRCITMLQGFHV